ncbi:hypothetical protein [Sinorhizobium meliloti]|uniref:Uncharacterized protein n=1 Tax=Rhizobium meliloti TaxID=382 RepID=A0A2J0Z0E8_RHIML|nr:hypothetical protein [Sinorhizobium meliloti]PJR13988.1 hypothetical protein CEJ86_19815 [Sinorhizobium meliloti]
MQSIAPQIKALDLVAWFFVFGLSAFTPSFATDAQTVKAVQDACAGLSSVNAQSERSSIKLEKYELTIDGGNSISVEENGVLLRKIENFHFSDYSKCMKDILEILSGTTKQGKNKDQHLEIKASQFSPDEKHISRSIHVRYGSDGENIHYLYTRLRLRIPREMANDTVVNSIDDPTVATGLADLRGTKTPDIEVFERLISEDGIDWVLGIAFSGAPPRETPALVLSVGPREWPVSIAPSVWKKRKYEYGSSEYWHISTGTSEVLIDQVDWPIVESARFLETATNDITLLQISLSNSSRKDILVKDLYLKAIHPSGVGVACDSSLPSDTLTLEWGKILSTKGKAGALISRNEDQVLVPVEFTNDGVCSPFALYAQVPLSVVVKSNSLQSFELRVVDLPPLNSSEYIAYPNGIPTGLHEWQKIGIGFSSDGGAIFPNETRIHPLRPASTIKSFFK